MAYYIFFFFSLLGFLQAGTLTTPATPFTGNPKQSDVSCCYISQLNQVFFTWFDTEDNNLVKYSVYSLIDNAFVKENESVEGSSSKTNVCCCYDSVNKRVFLSWKSYAQDSLGVPKKSYYDPIKKQSFPVQDVDQSNTQVGGSIVACCYNKAKKKVIYSWRADSTNQATFVETGKQSITLGTADKDVYCCSGASDRVYFSFSSTNNSTQSAVVYSFQVGESTTDLLSTVANITPVNNIFCSYNSINKNVIISWAEGEVTFCPYYAICSSTTPTFQSVTDITYQGNSELADVTNCFSTLDSSILFSWNDVESLKGYYAVLDTKSNIFTTPATLIDSTFDIQGNIINSCYIRQTTQTNKIFLSGAGKENPSIFPWYAIYSKQSPVPPVPPVPPVVNSVNNALNKFSPVKFQKGI